MQRQKKRHRDVYPNKAITQKVMAFSFVVFIFLNYVMIQAEQDLLQKSVRLTSFGLFKIGFPNFYELWLISEETEMKNHFVKLFSRLFLESAYEMMQFQNCSHYFKANSC